MNNKLEICKEYCFLVKEIENISKQFEISIYGLNQRRIELHNELCKVFEISKEQCLGITDRLNEIKYNPNTLKYKLETTQLKTRLEKE